MFAILSVVLINVRRCLTIYGDVLIIVQRCLLDLGDVLLLFSVNHSMCSCCKKESCIIHLNAIKAHITLLYEPPFPHVILAVK